jgi:hypothetical protein
VEPSCGVECVGGRLSIHPIAKADVRPPQTKLSDLTGWNLAALRGHSFRCQGSSHV